MFEPAPPANWVTETAIGNHDGHRGRVVDECGQDSGDGQYRENQAGTRCRNSRNAQNTERHALGQPVFAERVAKKHDAQQEGKHTLSVQRCRISKRHDRTQGKYQEREKTGDRPGDRTSGPPRDHPGITAQRHPGGIVKTLQGEEPDDAESRRPRKHPERE